jgi:2,3-bisphosphoglycerate-independent phosphoglycerate mutase
VEAIKAVDQCLIKIVDKVLEKGGTVLITADHGNAEMMVCPQTGNPFTAHTMDKVPFILVCAARKNAALREGGSLQDIAPTMLELLNIDIPPEMTGRSLIINNREGGK